MDIDKNRKKHNEDLIARMRRGDNLLKINMLESWYPIRPKIKKDENALNFITNSDKKKAKLETIKDTE